MIEPLDDFAAGPFDGRFHRGIAIAREGRHRLIERYELRSRFVQELRQHLFRKAAPSMETCRSADGPIAPVTLEKSGVR